MDALRGFQPFWNGNMVMGGWSGFPSSGQFNNFFGPVMGMGWNMPGLVGGALPFGMFNGSMISQSVAGSIGQGGWGSPQMLWPFLMGYVASNPQIWQQPERTGCHCHCECNPEWELFERQLQVKQEIREQQQQRLENRQQYRHYQPGKEQGTRVGGGTGGSGGGCTGYGGSIPQDPGGTGGGNDVGGSGGSGTEGSGSTSGCGPGGGTGNGCGNSGGGKGTVDTGCGPGGTGSGNGTTGGGGCGGGTPVEAPTDPNPPDDPTGPSNPSGVDPGGAPTDQPVQPTDNNGEWKPKPGQDAAWASQVLADNFDLLDTASGQGRDDLISREDMQALLANNPDAPPELRDACQLALRNQPMFNAMDVASGGHTDGLIGRDDLRTAHERFQNNPERPLPSQWTPAGTAEVLNRYLPYLDAANGGQADGQFGREDLQVVLNSPDAPAELREAARRALQNDHLFNTFDAAKGGSCDGVISGDDLKVAQEGLKDLVPEQLDGPMTEAQAARTLKRYMPLVDQGAGKGDWDQKIGREDLQALADDPDLPPDLRQAVDYLMGNPAVFNHFDQAGDSNGDLDNVIGMAGLDVLSASCP